MEITPATTPNRVGSKSPEPVDTETPARIQPTKLLSSFSNGVLKRHHHHHHHHQPAPVVVVYKECLKNHAANMGLHALDGCGEFMPSPSSTPTDPSSLKCAACGCHRNFHRREPEDPLTPPKQPPNTTATIEYQPHHRHHPPPPQAPQSGHRSPNSASPPPISSSYYTSAPAHMLLALSGGMSGPQDATNFNQSGSPSTRKRFRTKFTQTQKEKMREFAERVGWKMQKTDEDSIHEFCDEIGVDKGVLKVWMHNNKSTFGRRDVNGAPPPPPLTTTLNNGVSTASIAAAKNTNNGNGHGNGNGNGNDENKVRGIKINRDHHQYETHVGTNGSSSTS